MFNTSSRVPPSCVPLSYFFFSVLQTAETHSKILGVAEYISRSYPPLANCLSEKIECFYFFPTRYTLIKQKQFHGGLNPRVSYEVRPQQGSKRLILERNRKFFLLVSDSLSVRTKNYSLSCPYSFELRSYSRDC